MGIQSFLSITDRITHVFEKEELGPKDKTSSKPTDVLVKIENASFGWGFKIAEGSLSQNIKTSA